MLVCDMEKCKELPESMLRLCELPRAPAFEMREGKLIIKFEQDIPSIRLRGRTYLVTEGPSVIVGGKKLTIGEIV